MDKVRDYVSGLFCQHKLRLTDNSVDINTRLHHLNLTNISFVYLDYGAPVDVDPGCLKDFYLLQMIPTGQAKVSNGRHTHIANAGEATLLNPEKPTRIIASPGCKFLSIRINQQFITQQLAMLLDDTPTEPLIFESEMNLLSRNGHAIYNYINFLLGELDLLSKLPNTNATYQYFEQTLASMLIELHRHNYSDYLTDARSGQRDRHVRKAEIFMHNNLGREISMEDIAIAAQTTSRTLRNAFHRCHRKPPMGYLKTLRLKRARQLLAAASPNTNITRIAMDCGIKHLGRFSTEYRDLFGETPSQSIKEGRLTYLSGK